MANPARLNLDQDLPLLRQLELDLFDREGAALLLEGGPFERLGEFRCHVFGMRASERIRGGVGGGFEGIGVTKGEDDDDDDDDADADEGR